MRDIQLETDLLSGLLRLPLNDPDISSILQAFFGEQIYLIWANLDKTKRFNDFNGLPVGDALIKATGEIILENLPLGATGFRIKGDIFLCVLPYTTLEQSQIVAEMIRKKVSVVRLNAYDKWTAISQGITLSIVSASNKMEIAEYLTHAESLNNQAKSKGGNCVVCEL